VRIKLLQDLCPWDEKRKERKEGVIPETKTSGDSQDLVWK
jgi:hypothetical protein